MLSPFRVSLFPLAVGLAAVLSSSYSVHALRFVIVGGNSDFFDPIYEGFVNTCTKLNVNCTVYKNEPETLKELGIYSSYNSTIHGHDRWCSAMLQHFIETRAFDAIAAKCSPNKNSDGTEATHTWIQESYDAGIPTVVYDGPHVGPYTSYVGQDDFDVGRAMAKLLKQIRPEGGTYTTVYHATNTEQRAVGFVEEIEKDNNRTGRATWTELDLGDFIYELGYNPDHTGNCSYYSSFFDREVYNVSCDNGGWDKGLHSAANHRYEDGEADLQKIAAKNPTAIAIFYQTPTKKAGFTEFVDQIRETKNITFLGVDGNPHMINLVSRNHLDGVIGQQTYDIGKLSAEALYKAVTQGWDTVEPNYKTRMISHNLVPEGLPPLEVNQHLLGTMRYVGFFCFGIVGVLAILLIIWTLLNRTSRVIKASQPFFLVMIAFGVLTMASALIPLSFDDNGSSDISNVRAVGICMSVPWLVFNGFGITFSAMFAKTWRVNQFFKTAKTCGRIYVSERDVFLPAAVVFVLNNIVLVCWTIIDPLRYERNFELGTDLWNRDLASKGFCAGNNAAAYLVPLGLINIILLIVSCLQAWEARDIKSEFAESKWIGLAVFSMSQGFLTGIPIVVAVAQEDPRTFYLTLTLLLFVICMAVLLLIFLPKVIIHARYRNMTPAEQKKAMAASVRSSSGLTYGGLGPQSASVRFRLAVDRDGSAGKYNRDGSAGKYNRDGSSGKYKKPDVPSAVNEAGENNLSAPESAAKGMIVSKTTDYSSKKFVVPSTDEDSTTTGSMIVTKVSSQKTASYIDDDDDVPIQSNISFVFQSTGGEEAGNEEEAEA